ncbi:MAG: pre-toxin TG domain-containing protein [Candidatus Roizmanbacteria bacterium]|nr:pre-toxin TG domain-containing protein [Candidatus Roizmanbacteria bacterium]
MITILIFHLIVITQVWLVCRNKTVAFKELFHVFYVGATVVVLGNLIVQGIAAYFLDPDIIAYTITPVAEEVLKIAFVFFLFYKTAFGKSASIEDGILLGLAAGAGFGFAEDTIRALGLGLSDMVSYFQGYAWSGIPQVVTTWLPVERFPDEVFVPGHALWTALVGAGIGFAVKLKKSFPLMFILPIALLAWAIFDHAMVNVDAYSTPGSVEFLYALYGKGWGIKYVLTALIVLAVIIDEWILRKQTLPNELLLPGEKKRTILGELGQTLSHMGLGAKHWRGLLNYFSLRRKYLFLEREQEDTKEAAELLKRRKTYVLVSIEIDLPNNAHLSEGIHRVWNGPLLTLTGLTPFQKFMLIQGVGLVAIMVFLVWFFGLSLYIPQSLVRVVLNSPLVPILGIVGYAISLFHLVWFYVKKQWKKYLFEFDNRVNPYSQPLLVNSSGLNTLVSLPTFAGTNLLIPDRFLWDQIRRFTDRFREIQQWVGGTVSAAIGFIPGVGNAKSAVEFATGYDYIAGEELGFTDRALAGVGMIPVLGNFVAGVRGLKVIRATGKAINTVARVARGGKSVKTSITIGEKVAEGMYKARHLRKAEPYADAIDYLSSRHGLGKAVVEDYQHAFEEVGKALKSLDETAGRQLQTNRVRMLDEWAKSGGIEKVGTGHYQLSKSGQSVEVFVNDGVKTLKSDGSLNHVGQVTVDHTGKNILFDNVTDTYSPDQITDAGREIAALQQSHPDYTISFQKRFNGPFSQVTTLTLDGGTVSYWSVSAKLPAQTARAVSVSSR